jgi:hypothetical protein
MQRMRQHGKERMRSKQSFQIFLPIYPNLEDEILLKGGRICNTLILLSWLLLKFAINPFIAFNEYKVVFNFF